MSEGWRRFLPDWNYWAAVPIAALVAVAIFGLVSQSHDQNPQQFSNRSQPEIDLRTPDERLADYTLWLERFTGALVIVTAFQILFLIRADRTARISANAARDAANAATTQATQSASSAAIMAQQSDILEKQRQVAYLQYVAENRPRLRLRNISIAENNQRQVFHTGQMSGECYLQNIGGMSATILESYLEIYANQRGLPMGSPYEGKPANDVFNGRINVGQSVRFTFQQTSPFATAGECDRAHAGTHPTYILGWIHYRDDSQQGIVHGVIYRLAFARRWDSGYRRFFPAPDLDYEHDG